MIGKEHQVEKYETAYQRIKLPSNWSVTKLDRGQVLFKRIDAPHFIIAGEDNKNDRLFVLMEDVDEEYPLVTHHEERNFAYELNGLEECINVSHKRWSFDAHEYYDPIVECSYQSRVENK